MRTGSKHLLVLILLVAFVGLMLAGCSSQQPATKTEPPKTEAPKTDAPKAAEAPAIKYPTKPIKLIVPNGAGGSVDLGARLIQPYLSKYLNNADIVVENVPAGGTKIGTNQVYKAEPDGHTLLNVNNPTLSLNAACFEVPYDVNQFVPVYAYSGGTGSTLTVAANSPYKTWQDVVKAGKEKRLTMSVMSGVTNSGAAYALFAQQTGVTFDVMPFETGNQALLAVLGGHANIAFNNSSDVMGRHGKDVRALVILLPQRHRDLPDVPAFAETYPGVSLENAMGLIAPPKTPKAVVDIIAGAMDKVCKDKEFIEKASKNFDVVARGPEEFGKLIKFMNDSSFKNKDAMVKLVAEGGSK